MRLAFNVFTTRDIALARRLVAEKASIREAESRAADSHFARLREGRPESIETSAIHLDVIRDLKRINGHLASVGLSDPRGRRRTRRHARLEGGSALDRAPGGIEWAAQRDLRFEPRASEIGLELAAVKPGRIYGGVIAAPA